MKTTIFRSVFAVAFLALLIACSVRRNNFVSRNMHALATKDNILYNGGRALDKGLVDVKQTYKDNFWEIFRWNGCSLKCRYQLTERRRQKTQTFNVLRKRLQRLSRNTQ